MQEREKGLRVSDAWQRSARSSAPRHAIASPYMERLYRARARYRAAHRAFCLTLRASHPPRRAI